MRATRSRPSSARRRRSAATTRARAAAARSSSSATAPPESVKLQLLSDLHQETETFTPEPAPGAELLVLAGDIDSTWKAFDAFRGWPVPIVFVAGNHEFDGRELNDTW